MNTASRLRTWTIDYDGTPMVDGESPRDGLHCSDLRDAADKIDRLQTALAWYGDEAEAIARKLNGTRVSDKAQAIEASLTVLALDGGRRAKSALEQKLDGGKDVGT